MEIKGTINAIFPTEQVSDNFTKRILWVETKDNPTYPQLIQLEFTKDKVGELDKYKAGDLVSVEFNLRGRQWKDKVFNTLQAWKIVKTGESTPAAGQQPEFDMSAPGPVYGNGQVADKDPADLPF